MVDKSTGVEVNVILKKHNEFKSDVRIEGCKPSIARGYAYGGDGCYYWGTIYTGNDCSQLFVLESDPMTQLLMNHCEDGLLASANYPLRCTTIFLSNS